MKFPALLSSAVPFLRSVVFGRRVPLFVSWNLTFDCDLDCGYCGVKELRGISPLAAGSVEKGLEELRRLGTRWITFGGGEPLLRGDIARILAFARSRGMRVFLSTNGNMLPEKPEVLSFVDHVNLSLDGRREVHDSVRGRGSFDKVMEAAALCRSAGVDMSFLCVLSSRNLEETDAVLSIASGVGASAMFQPATVNLNSSSRPNVLAPAPEKYRLAIDRIVMAKRRGAAVRNSISGLKYLRSWPGPAGFSCPAGRITAVVEPDGSLLPCHTLLGKSRGSGIGTFSPVLLAPFSCRECPGCWCAPLVELGLMNSLEIEPIVNSIRSLCRY